MVGAELVVRALVRRGVTTIFSLSGNQIMPLYDACIDAKVRIVHVRHEAAAVFMADAWAQVTGEIGVAMLTAGPGVSNGIAPLYSALQAESPVLLLSGDSPLQEDGTGSFQELDLVSMTTPLTKLSQRVMGVGQLVGAVDHAISTALAPRRGPVHLALPFDVLTSKTDLEELPGRDDNLAIIEPRLSDLRAIAQLLSQAKKPVVLLGPSQCRHQMKAHWQSYARDLQVPVIPMESPRGLKDPSLGSVAESIAEADLIVLAGKKLDFTLGFGRVPPFAPDARVVVIDPEQVMLDRAEKLLDSKLAIRCLSDAERAFKGVWQMSAAAVDRREWIESVDRGIRSRTLELRPNDDSKVSSRALCEAVQEFIAIAKSPIVVCDGGEFGQWAQAFCSAPLRVINGIAGAIGGGICYAIAAKIARPDATVVLLMGDGTAGFHFAEFDTAMRERAPFMAIVGNDLRWNAEHVIQLRTYGADRLIGCSLSASARYDEAAEAFGGFGVAVHRADLLAPSLRAAASSCLPACINVAIDGQPAPVFAKAQSSASTH